MSYHKAVQLLPDQLLKEIQKYVDGEYIYIPRKNGKKKGWGENTSIRQEIAARDREIYELFQEGTCTRVLAERYFLSVKSVQRILRGQRNGAKTTLNQEVDL